MATSNKNTKTVNQTQQKKQTSKPKPVSMFENLVKSNGLSKNAQVLMG